MQASQCDCPYIDAFKNNAEVIAITTSITACRDANDHKVLKLAVSAKAPIIISGDKDLLTMSPFRGIEILSPRQFLAEFSSSAPMSANRLTPMQAWLNGAMFKRPLCRGCSSFIRDFNST